jgi:hypothetical protein
MLSLWSNGDGAPFVLLCRADTVDLARTATANGCGEFHLDHLVLPVVNSWSPTGALLSFGADRELSFPINNELTGIDALLRVGLPRAHRRAQDQGRAIPYCWRLDQNGSGNRAGIEEMLRWGKVCLLEISMHCLGDDLIGSSSGGGSHMENEMRGIFLNRVSVRCTDVSRPPRFALFAIAGLLIIGALLHGKSYPGVRFSFPSFPHLLKPVVASPCASH